MRLTQARTKITPKLGLHQKMNSFVFMAFDDQLTWANLLMA